MHAQLAEQSSIRPIQPSKGARWVFRLSFGTMLVRSSMYKDCPHSQEPAVGVLDFFSVVGNYLKLLPSRKRIHHCRILRGVNALHGSMCIIPKSRHVASDPPSLTSTLRKDVMAGCGYPCCDSDCQQMPRIGTQNHRNGTK